MVWVSYIVLLPLAAAGAVLFLLLAEWTRLPYPPAHKLFDSLIAALVVASFALSRTFPQIVRKFSDVTRAPKVAAGIVVAALIAVVVTYSCGLGR